MDSLVLIPLVLTGYARYLKGIDDTGRPFEPSPDPLLTELQAIVAPLEIGGKAGYELFKGSLFPEKHFCRGSL